MELTHKIAGLCPDEERGEEFLFINFTKLHVEWLSVDVIC